MTGSKDLKAASIDILSPKISYTSTFEQYELKNRPFKANFEIQADENSVASILNLDYNEFYGRMYPLSDMVGRVDSNGLVVPKFAVNNYLLPGKHIESSAADSSYFTQWPAVMPLSARYQTSSGFQCPSNMHLLAWHYAVEGAEISARLFPISASAEYFESALFSEAARSEQLQANLTTSPFSGYFNRYLRHGFPATKGKGSDSREDSNAELPPFAETKLTSSEYIFVPNNYLASFQCNPQSTSDHTDADSNDDKVHCAILALCFVDASNLNLFRDSVFLNGKVSVLEVTVHAAVTSPTFDPQMLKQPADVYLREYWTAGVRDSKDNSDSSAMSSQTPAPPVSAVSPPDAARRDRRRRGSADFKDWQDSNKWKTLITSLTIPAPPAPHLLAVGRDHASLSWSSPFVPPQSDKTSFGFRIIFCKLADGPQRTESFALPFASAAPDPDCESSKLLRGSDGGAGRSGGLLVLEEELDAALLRRTGVESVLFKTVLRSPSPPPLLLPDTLYQLRLVICYDQWESPPSPYSAPFRTKSQTVPSSPLALPLAHADPSVTVSTIDPAILASTRTVTAVHGGRRVVGLLEFAWPSGKPL